MLLRAINSNQSAVYHADMSILHANTLKLQFLSVRCGVSFFFSPSSQLTTLYFAAFLANMHTHARTHARAQTGAARFARVKNTLKMGCVGLPNVGKSSTFNLLCDQTVDAENYPFCTIDPSVARCEVQDPRYVFVLIVTRSSATWHFFFSFPLSFFLLSFFLPFFPLP